jgi:AAA+ ATPase superfamily predicted ATPase
MNRQSEDMVDRGDEVARFRELLERGTPQLVLLYGRRRVGKTYLLNRAWGADVPSFYFTASETTPAQNREALLLAFAQWSGMDINVEDYPTWRTVFRLLLDHRLDGPLVLALDEFQYLGEDEKDLASVASELNAAWEMRRTARPLVLVLSGSAVRTIESLNTGGAPLYGRFAWQCRLRPFNYWHAGEMAGFAEPSDRARAFAVFGGTPRYLEPIDSALPLAENIIRLMLHPSGEVRELVQTTLLQEQGLREIPKYVAVLRAIGHGRTELNEIAQAAGLEKGTTLRDKIGRLIDLDYVKASRNLGASRTTPYRYRVSDPALRFFYDIVAPLESALATQDPAGIWRDLVEPRFDTYMGHLFETIVEEGYYRLQVPLGLPVVKEWGRWEGLDRDRRPVEIDIASELGDGRLMSGAVKWNRAKVDVQVHLEHLEMLSRLASAGVEWAHRALDPGSALIYVASNGFTDRFRKAAEASRNEVYLWSLVDLYQ